jgi:hypothetical protein
VHSTRAHPVSGVMIGDVLAVRAVRRLGSGGIPEGSAAQVFFTRLDERVDALDVMGVVACQLEDPRIREVVAEQVDDLLLPGLGRGALGDESRAGDRPQVLDGRIRSHQVCRQPGEGSHGGWAQKTG